MLWVCAYTYDLELHERVRTFKAITFAASLADDRRSGTVTLHPEVAVLSVGSCTDDCSCVRIFSADGLVVGTMKRSPTGEVTWSTRMRSGGHVR